MRVSIEALRLVGSGRIARHARDGLDGRPLLPAIDVQPPCQVLAYGVERLANSIVRP